MAYDTRDGGVGRTPAFYSGSSVNPQPRNPRADKVTCDPRSPPPPSPVQPLSQPLPSASPSRGLKPL